MTDTLDLAAIVDGAAKVIAGAVDGHIFAAGTTTSVTGSTPEVVPLGDDFTEAGLPAVTVAMSTWAPRLQPGNERLHLELACAVWRPRVPIGDVVPQLYADRDAIADAWIAHSKAYTTEAHLQSAVLIGGPGIVPRSAPSGSTERMFLTLPFRVEIVCNRSVSAQPA